MLGKLSIIGAVARHGVRRLRGSTRSTAKLSRSRRRSRIVTRIGRLSAVPDPDRSGLPSLILASGGLLACWATP
jgi:hypothetical protein